MDQAVRMIFFDVGETLVRPRRPFGDLLKEIARELGVDVPGAAFSGLARHVEGRVIDRTHRGMPFTFPKEASRQFWFDTYNGYLGQFVAPVDADRLTRRLLGLLSSPQGYELYADTRVTLDRLRRRGYRLGVISNWEAWLPALLAELGIADDFEHVVISGECGFEKPDARIFACALRESGYRPDEIVYVGDRPAHDVEPALTAGIRPILLDRIARYPESNQYQTIASLHELVLALDGSLTWLAGYSKSPQARPHAKLAAHILDKGSRHP